MSTQVAQGQTLGASWEIRVRSGTVDSTDTRSETEVSGSFGGGGGVTVGGTGGNMPVSGQVKSKTTRYQNIYLTDEDGKEHAIELVDFLIPCKQGHKLSLFLLFTGGSDFGSYFRAYNHNTGQHYEYGKAVRSELFPNRVFMLATGIVGALMLMSGFSDGDAGLGEVLLLTALVTAMAAGVFWVIGSIVGFVRSMPVTKNPTFRGYLGQLTR